MAKKRKPRRFRLSRPPDPGRKGPVSEAETTGLIPASIRRWIGLGFDVALALVCLIFVVKSAAVVSKARFFTDECFHTYIVEQVIETGTSPAVLYDLYSGMRNNTHPLFHWVAAPFYLASGRAGLAYVNVVLCGVLLGSLYWIVRVWVNAWAARIAVAVTLLFSVIHICTQIFYVEVFSALTFTLGALALTVALSQTDWKVYFLAGVACALALLSKQTGYTLLPVVALSGLWTLVRRRWRHVIGMAVLTATFLGAFAVGMNALSRHPLKRFSTIYAPVEKRIVPEPFRLFGRKGTRTAAAARTASVHDPSDDLQPSGGGVSPVETPGTRREKPYDSDAEAMLEKTFGRTPRQILGEWWAVLGPLGAVFTALCLAHLFLARRQGSIAGFGATAPLLIGMALLLIGAVHIGTVDRRHFISWIPALAACTGMAVTDLVGRVRPYGRSRVSGRELVMGVTVILIAVACVTIVLIPNYRTPYWPGPSENRPMTFRERQYFKWLALGQDAPAGLIEAARAIGELGADNRTVLAVWTSDAWYYSGHPATWAGVNVKLLNSLLRDPRPDRAWGPYLRADIGYLLIDNTRVVEDEKYRGVEYTETFCRHVVEMLQTGTVHMMFPDARQIEEQLVRRRAPLFGNRALPFLVVEIDREKLKEAIARMKASSAPEGSETGVTGP
ncbi:MAG: DUF2029 domain-containing protein [Verrucomicrobia bacterium]|nr:DUF2029 domain-containing protein [Verrucomicrobiota bacterium]